jgi:hypothetical protein
MMIWARRGAGLLAVTLAVVGAHVVLLRGLPEVLRPAERSTPRALLTRTMAPVAVVKLRTVPQPAPQPGADTREGMPAARFNLQAVAARAPTQTRGPALASASMSAVAAEASPVVAAPTASASVPASPPATPSARSDATTRASEAFDVPAPVRLRYQVTASTRMMTLHGESELRWRHDGQTYEAQLEVSAPLLPSRRQTSTGAITADGLAPQRFSDKARSEEAAHFQRDKGVVTFSSNRADAQLMPRAQDRLSVLLQLGALVAGKPGKFPPSSTISIQTASTRDAEDWHFTVEGEEQLQLPGGTVPALKLTRNPRKEFDQKLELWLGTGMDYVPVRLRLTQPNGDWVDQRWSSTDKG